ncbi:kinase-like domain-containing protein [Rhizophagus irregularis DAOM 181602=DAOM 197198]|nr:kinase-like domain-containing protein [Rhizophagus irregularis DAOM 181602=DAOM 197198]
MESGNDSWISFKDWIFVAKYQKDIYDIIFVVLFVLFIQFLYLLYILFRREKSSIEKRHQWQIEDNEKYGVIPFIAPEIFRGSRFSKESDVYCIWV